MRPLQLFVFLYLGAGCASEDPVIRNLVPVIGVAPEAVAFGDVGVALWDTKPVFIRNAGGADLTVQTSFSAFDGVFSLDGDADFVLRPNEERILDVRFTPDTYRDYEGLLEIESNDAESPTDSVVLTGTGADLPLPDIAIRPGQTIEVLNLAIGQQGLLVFEVANEGGADLILEALRLDGPPSFVLETNRTGTRVVPGDSVAMLVSYTPVADEGAFADLFIVSNDPDEPETQVRLVANDGGPLFDRPVAAIDCPDEVLLTGPEIIELSGAPSYDPDGLDPLFYQWSVPVRPEGSDSDRVLDPDDTQDVELYVDVAGNWEVELRVRNAVWTLSDPATCSFGAVPEDALHVELSWDGPTADVDLHLLQGGADLFDPTADCNYCNKHPNWGSNGTIDDPRLDIDDRGGYGPENINIEDPADGTYDVKVHYFKPNDDGAIVATLNVWTYGSLVWSGSRVLTSRYDLWSVGTIDIPSGLFAVDGAPNSRITDVGCN